ncbi:aldose epimerase family protein [Maliponia aquimaris]|uniref:Aldose 1-epimerase n=1 Tax=Maliponia aquimaris TaxID=1673631 RepID=A0A238JMZ1_9RHOB|nr:aldose epimerase family protein [Maliponia aquimaris]SMX32011.1 Aldose 1-epimerase precursor [Maliponia aquimaris]
MTDTITSHVLADGDTAVTVLSLGCAVQDWQVAGRRVVLGYDDPEAYRDNPRSMGIVVGRVANRTAQGRFTLDGTDWQLPVGPGGHHLHGGPNGLGKRNWALTPDGPRGAVLRLSSPHLDQGYPGAVDFEVRLTLDGSALTWEMTARPDRPTPVNLAQHLYFNLAGAGTVRDHVLRLNASRYTPAGPDLVPTGEVLPVTGSRYDFLAARSLAEADPQGAGYDLNFALDGGTGPAAELVAPDGMTLRLWTDQPGLQLYTSTSLAPFAQPWPGVAHGPWGGICLEAQGFPNALNTPGFPPIVVTPDTPYRQVTTIDIAPR